MKYTLGLVVLIAISAFAQDTAQSLSVMERLERLAKDSRNPVDQSQQGWIIVDVPGKYTRYFFTSNTQDPAHPAMFERVVLERDGVLQIGTNVTCEGDQAACDSYLEYFKLQDQQMQETMRDTNSGPSN